MPRVTIADVASEAGLSKTAVSFALNDNWQGKLSPGAVKRAKNAAEKLGYRPNHAARTLRNQVTASVGFLSTEVSTTRFAIEMISGALNAANELEHALLIAETAPKRLSLGQNQDEGVRSSQGKKALSALMDRQIDGLVIAEMGAKQIAEIELPKDLPVVYLNCTLKSPCFSILPDENRAGRDVVEALVKSALVSTVLLIGTDKDLETNPELSVTIGDRIRSIRDALSEEAINVIEFPGAVWNNDLGYKAFKEAYKKHQPDAVIALNDQVAFGVYQVCSEIGLTIGKDISVVSFDDEELSRLVRPQLTTAALPYEEMGRLAVEHLLGGELGERTVRVEMPIKHRASIRQKPS